MSNKSPADKISDKLGDAKHLLGISNESFESEENNFDNNESNDNNDNDRLIEKPDIDSIFAPSDKAKIVNKGFTIREDQARKIRNYSKRAKKKESEFIRDILDYVFDMIESEE